MAKRKFTQLAYDALTLEGGIFNAEWLAKVAHLDAPRQKPDDYGILAGLNLRDEIARAWRIAQALWIKFHASRGAASGSSAATEKFVVALLEAFGFSGLAKLTSARSIGERSFPISHTLHRIPVVVAAHTEGLDEGQQRFGEAGRRRSPFGLLQEYLNAADQSLWGLVSNGLKLRLVRDNASLTRPAWLEADLERIFTEERFADFSALWLTIHISRFGAADSAPTDCALETWREAGQQAGTRAREELRKGVERALLDLGQGFLGEASNTDLRAALVSGTLTPTAYFQQLLRLVYRLIFLLTVEERGLLHPPGSDGDAQALYERGYSLRRLRERAVRHSAHDTHRDLYASLTVTFRGLATGEPRLTLPALGGLFATEQTPVLDAAQLQNRYLLSALWALAWIARDGATERVNWRDMGPEELGSVYESLLELVPQVGESASTFRFAGGDETRGNARKLSGSYYTPDSLVQLLLDSALEPVIAQKMAEKPGDEAEAILSITVIDPAVGSGHFLLAAARRLAAHLARIRAQGQPGAAEHRKALRDVVSHCLFGVDRNPMALELAKIALWLEAMTPDAPLSFLDTHLVLGDALLGVLDPACLVHGIPDDAYRPLTGDDKDVCARLKKRNKDARKTLEKLAGKGGQQVLGFAAQTVAVALAKLDALPDDTLEQIAAKRAAYGIVREQQQQAGLAEDLLLSAYLMSKQSATEASTPTSEHVMRALTGQLLDMAVTDATRRTARRHHVFHWRDAFAQVFARGGFDCVLGNPPWERIKLQEQEFFASRAPEVANARNKAERLREIEKLKDAPIGSPDRRVIEEFEHAKRLAEAAAAYAHDDLRFPLTGVGDVNTYALFAETALRISDRRGRVGIILPTGIATDDNTKGFFQVITDTGRLASFFDFRTGPGLWADIGHQRFKFCLLTIGESERADFSFFLTSVAQLSDSSRRFTLTTDELRLLNPNTRTCPIFWSKADAELTKKIYRRLPVFWDEGKSSGNSWGVSFLRMFDMSGDSELFRIADRRAELNRPIPLYEAKLIHHFDHRWGTYAGVQSSRADNDDEECRALTEEEKSDPSLTVTPRYWLELSAVEEKLKQRGWKQQWLMGWRDICRSTDYRTLIAGIIPMAGVGDKFLLFTTNQSTALSACLVASMNSLVCDFVARQKVGGTALKYFTMRQIAILPPRAYSEADLRYLVPRILELTFTANDLKPFYDDAVAENPAYDPRTGADRARPFIWNPGRRAQLRAELDAYFARLYGLTRDELRYVLDPADVMGSGYPSETFRVLKEKEVRQFGEYRTRRLVLAAWDSLENATPLTLPAAQPARRTQPHPAYAAQHTPCSATEDWLVGLVCDVIAYTGSVDDRTLRLILTMQLAHGTTPYVAELADWRQPIQADRLPQVFGWLRALFGVPLVKNLAISDPARLSEILGDHRTEALARALVDAYREQEAALANVMRTDGADSDLARNDQRKQG